jgi:hypothetical protein
MKPNSLTMSYYLEKKLWANVSIYPSSSVVGGCKSGETECGCRPGECK